MCKIYVVSSCKVSIAMYKTIINHGQVIFSLGMRDLKKKLNIHFTHHINPQKGEKLYDHPIGWRRCI